MSGEFTLAFQIINTLLEQDVTVVAASVNVL